jgi:gas vesicle protein
MTKNAMFRKPLMFMVGGIVGTGAALLFAPASGKETRDKIGGFTADMKERAKCYAMRGRDKMTGTAKKTKGYFLGRKSLFSAALEAGKIAYLDEKKRLTKAR